MFDKTAIRLDSPLFTGRLKSRRDYTNFQPQIIQPLIGSDYRSQSKTKPESEQEPAMFPLAHGQALREHIVARDQHVSHQQPSVVLMREAVKPQGQIFGSSFDKPKPKKQFGLAHYALSFMAAGVFSLGVYVSLVTLHSNKIAETKVAALTNQVSTNSSTVASGESANSNYPSSVPIVAADISNYSVGPTKPRYLDITKIGVHARVMPLSIDKQGALAAPNNVFDTGWYKDSSLPGENGAMLIDGHISSWTANGVFYDLKKVTSGDKITIVRGDGKNFTYKVVKTDLVAASSVDMSSLMVSADTNKPGLNIISCSGEVVPGTNEFDKRLVVYSVLQ